MWWQQKPLELITLMRGLSEAYPDHSLGRVGRALVVRLEVELDTLRKRRRLALIFPGAPSRVRPIVMADGPTRSRHRFTWARPTSLCLYYGRDDEGLRWTLRDGAVALVDLARVHLIKEAWWRATGEWNGYEVHRAPAGTEQQPRSATGREKKSVDLIRRARARCWCGGGRYTKCHGSIPVAHELSILALA
jgi:hypothetical protein